MKVTEYDNRKVVDLAYGEVIQGSVAFYSDKGKVVLNFTRNIVSVYRRTNKGWNNGWDLLNEWELNR